MHKRIYQHVAHIVQLIECLLNDYECLNIDQVNQLETMHLRAVNFLIDFDERVNLPIDQFASYLNHDAMTPITVVLGYAELLNMEASGMLNEYQKGFMERIVRRTHTLHEDLKAILIVALRLRAEAYSMA